MTDVLPCPVCGKPPIVEKCEPLLAGGYTGWYVGCYGMGPSGHHVGVNANDEAQAIGFWNAIALPTAKRKPGLRVIEGGQT